MCDGQNIIFTVGTLLECLTHILLIHRAWRHKDYVVWLWDPLNITFMISGDCDGYGYLLYGNGDHISVPCDHVTVGEVKFFTFMVTNVTEEFDNASMQVIGTDGGHSVVKPFTIRAQGQ